MIAPIDFIKEKYIIPNNITQDMLCESLDIGKKTISELYQHKRGFTLHTAKKFAQFFDLKPEFIMMKQIEYDLAKDKEDYSNIKPFVELQQETEIQNNSKWILASINNSISDEKNHYTIEDLYDIFATPSTDKKYHYAITIIFKEVDYNDIIKYCELNNISRSNLKALYNFYKTTYNSKKVNEYEWLFKEL